uniref:Zinc finger protein 26 n=1 Tax=Cacopsylla melanoneura TaxID=428564 RepID=A0A8D9BPK8_9HEMI
MPRTDNQYIYGCTMCSYHCSGRRFMIRHIARHKKIKKVRSHKCPECEYTARSLSGLKNHIRVHSSHKPYKCSNCEYKTAYNYALRRHKLICLDSDPPSPITAEKQKNLRFDYCIHCEEEFSGDIIEHCRYCPSKPKTDERYNYYCTMCNFHSRLRCFTVRHIDCHKKVRPYKCTQCDYAAPKPGIIRVHMRMHTGEKPYKCLKCGATFSVQASMNAHNKRCK